jgi:plasmid stabilization system protein ParE
MHVRFHPDAQHELADAAVWYEQRREGLGSELQRRVRDALKRIASNPAAWPRWPELPEVRVYPLSRFPFLLPYFLDEALLVILAVAHGRRRPGYWQNRLQHL